jgi:hypothetical protein
MTSQEIVFVSALSAFLCALYENPVYACLNKHKFPGNGSRSMTGVFVRYKMMKKGGRAIVADLARALACARGRPLLSPV